MEALKVQTHLTSRYRVFDASGKLPFDIVFGFRRRSSQDKDPRDISFKVTGSIIDVPHALSNGLLRLCEVRTSESGATEHTEVDLTSLRAAVIGDDPESEYFVLPSKANRTVTSSSGSFTAFRYRVHPGSPLAALFLPGQKYSIGLVERDLGLHGFIEARESTESESSKEPCRLVSNPHSGSAVFQVVESLAWPLVTTRMRLLEDSANQHKTSDQEAPHSLEVTVTNMGSRPISMQTRGHQRFLRPWGVLQPEDAATMNDIIPCIINTSAPSTCLQVVQTDTGSVVKGRVRPRRGCAGVTFRNIDLRPKVEDLLVLEPGVPVSRKIELNELLRELEDGKYYIQLRPEGCWWHEGVLESEPGDDDKVPRHVMNQTRTPLMLETEDKVAFRIGNGKIIWDI